MRSIAFVTQKGGAGKTTLASNVAVAALRAGERVFICDLDPVQSFARWSSARKTRDVPTQHVPPGKLAQALEELAKSGVTLVVIDTPGADSEMAEQAIRCADLCIIPARPNALDLWASEITLARVKAHRKNFAFLLNQCPPAQQSARVQRGAQALQEMGALLGPLISTRVDYQEAVRLGFGVLELNPNGIAAREIGQLWTSLKRRLDELSAAATAREAADSASRAQPARSPYPDLISEAIKVGAMYSTFLNAFLQLNDAKTTKRLSSDQKPADATKRE